MRYLIHNHPAFPGLLSKEDLYALVERSSLARGDLCTDVRTGRDHTVGEVISGMRPPRASSPPRVDRPAYQEFRADDLHEIDETPPQDEDEEDSEEDAEDEEEEEDEKPRYTESGERIWHFGHPSWLSYWKGLFLTLLCLFAAGLLFSLDEAYSLVAGLCGIAVFIGVSIARRSHDYIVTDERVEYVWGILGRSSKEVRICDIRSLDVWEKGLKGFLLRLGTLDVSSAGTAGIEVRFSDIRQAHKVKELIRQLQRGVDPEGE
jgi:hypothetical protein